jgi:hypothetical protein
MKGRMMKHALSLGGLLGASVGVSMLLAGCAAVDANVNHGNLVVNTHLSETVFLDPVPVEKRTIYVSMRNTSDHPELDISGSLRTAVAQRGYLVVQDPNKAQYMLRANVLQAGEVDANSKAAMLSASYGQPLLAGVLAAGTTSALGGNTGTTAGVGLGVAAASFAANQIWQQKTYSVVIDIELSSRPLSGGKVSQTTASIANNANSSYKTQSSGTPTGAGMQGSLNTATGTFNGRSVTQQVNEASDFKKYQIRAMAYADQINLKFEMAVQPLETKLTSALANLFEEGPMPTMAQVDAAFAIAAAPPAGVTPLNTAAPTKAKARPKAPAPTASATNLDDTPPPPPRP